MIALFDSGYGGLTALAPLLKLLPQYDYMYLGDNMSAPYGNHSNENIIKFSEQAVEYLFSKGAKLIIFACNTASAVALREVQKKYLKGIKERDRKILGVLIPSAQRACELAKNKKIAVVGTRATINSEVYDKEIHKISPKMKVYKKACPLLVPMIEEDWHTKPEAVSILRKYLRSIKSYNVDVLILGCTHYPLMMKDFKRCIGKKVKIVSSGDTAAEKLKDYLEHHPEIEQRLSKNRKRIFLTTDKPEEFKAFTEKHFGMKIHMPEKIKLGGRT